MRTPSREDLRSLVSQPRFPSVSILFRTERSTPRKAPAKVKSLLREAREQLRAAGIERQEAEDVLRPATALLDDLGRWQRPSDGAALYVTGEGCRHYELPYEPRERVAVSAYPQITGLLPLFSAEGWFYVLAISQSQVRLFEATRDRIAQIPTPGLPGKLTDVVGSEFEDASVHIHTAGGGGMRSAPAYHGTGAQVDAQKEEVGRFLKRIDSGLKRYLRRGEAPLVLAAVDWEMSAYRELSRLRNLAPDGIAGSPDELAPEQLHARAWPVVEPVLQAPVERALVRCRELLGGPRASTDLAEILGAGEEGRIDILLLAASAERWGGYDVLNRLILEDLPAGEQREELLNLAAVLCLRGDGSAFEVARERLPDSALAAAIFRY